MNNRYGPSKIWDEEYFKQGIQAPEAAPLQKGFWEKMGPEIMGAIANIALPGSGSVAKVATTELQGGDPITPKAPTDAVSGMQVNTDPVNVAGNIMLAQGPLGETGQFNNQYNKPFDNEEYMRRFGGFNYA